MRALKLLPLPLLATALIAVPAAGARLLGGGVPSVPSVPAHAAPCRALTPTRHLRVTLRRVHRRTLAPGAHARGPVGRVLYGRCGRRFYAFASFRHRINGMYFGTQDQPERFSRRAHHRWRDRGDTGGDLCGLAPFGLTRAWSIHCPVR